MMWRVDDEAAVQVGSNFYKHLLNKPHKGPESAICETRLAVGIERTWPDGTWLTRVRYSLLPGVDGTSLYCSKRCSQIFINGFQSDTSPACNAAK